MLSTYKRAVAAALVIGCMPFTANATPQSAQESILTLFPGLSKGAHAKVETLAEAAAQTRRYAGVAPGYGLLMNNEAFEQIVRGEFNYMTPENSGKWGPLQPFPGEWNFETHDQMVAYAQEHDLAYKGHALVWHSQAPSFVNDDIDADELQALIDEHITTTVSRYAGQIRAWDVVNEAMGDNAEYRDSVLYRKLGADFIANAFYTAHSIDRRAKLFYNDYNIAGLNAKSDAVYAMVKGLVEARVPIDGVGFQMHLTASNAPSYEELVANLSRFADLGLLVNISELDVRIADMPWDFQTSIAIQRQVYHRVVSACLAVRRCEAVTTWGVSDQYSWINSTFGEDAALAWDDDFQRKPAYYGMLDGFMGVAPDESELPNLVDNSEFEGGVQGWSGVDAEVERAYVLGRDRGNAMLIHSRVSRQAGAVYDFTAKAIAGQTYNVSAQVKTPLLTKLPLLTRLYRLAFGDTVELNAELTCADGEVAVVNLETAFADFGRWQTVQGSFTVPQCALESVALAINGTLAGTDILVDQVVARPQVLVPSTEGFGDNLIVNPYFEEDASGWYGFGGASVELTSDTVKSGVHSGYVSNRTATWQGPATSVLDGIIAGDIYHMFAWVRVEGASSRVGATIALTCEDGEAQYLNVANASASADRWTLLTGSVQLPECELFDATLYFEGPDADVNMMIDEVYLRRDNAASDALDIVDDGNLHPNGGFELGTQHWSTWGGSLSTTSTYVHDGAAAGVLSGRTATWQGPVFDLLSVASAGGEYEISAWGMVQGASQDTLNITVRTICGGNSVYRQVASTLVNSADWTQLSGTIVLPSDCDLTEATLYFDGPAVGVDTYLDSVFIAGDAPLAPNLVGNGDFESGIDGWQVWGGVLSSSEEAHTGALAALHTGRTATWQGPVYPITAVAGASYNISSWIKVAGAATATANINLRTICADGSELYNWGGQAEVNSAGWTEVAGVATVPAECEVVDAVVYFAGPDVGVDILIDDVVVTGEGGDAGGPDNLVTNSGFEEDLDGWVSWGGALSRSSDQSYAGDYAAYLTSRAGSWEGPVYNLLGAIESGASYDISAFGRVDSGVIQTMSITLKITCDDGYEEYLWGGSADVFDTEWSEVSGSIALPACNLTEASLYFGGPDQEVGIYLDAVSVTLAD